MVSAYNFHHYFLSHTHHSSCPHITGRATAIEMRDREGKMRRERGRKEGQGISVKLLLYCR